VLYADILGFSKATLQQRDLFSWNDIPGNDNWKLVEFLKSKYNIDWVITEKIDNGMTINVFTEKNSLSLRLNNEKTKVNLKIDDSKTFELNVRTENNKLNIYQQIGQAENTLREFCTIFSNLVKQYDKSNISTHNFSDSIVVGFKEINDALKFSETLFYETFMKEIPLRGTIGIGEFNHKPNRFNKFSFTIGSGLVIASVAEKYHIKGHTLLLVCEDKENTHYRDGLSVFEDEEIHILSKEYKAYIVPWWERSKPKEINNEIDRRTQGLDSEKIIYLEKTKEHMNYYKDWEKQPDLNDSCFKI
jgi:hypothetical protein